MKRINAKDIRRVMECHGESLTDLGADYAPDFLKWFKSKEPTVYKDWLRDHKKQMGAYGEKANIVYLADRLLFDFSTSGLGGRISKIRYDALLAEFANTNPDANEHISELLEELVKD